jgi:cytochrome c-type biogenesis protein CcmH
MVLWLIMAVLAALPLAVLVWAVLRHNLSDAPASGVDTALYKEQLAAAESDEAKAEIGRRILRAGRYRDDGAFTSLSVAARYILVGILIVVVFGLSFGLYSLSGKPSLPTQPRGLQSEEEIAKGATIQELVPFLASKMRKNPDDATGWQLLATTASNIGRFDIATTALANLARLQPGNSIILASWAEATISLEQGLVTPAARDLLQQALALDATMPAPQYYMGLYAKQQGDNATALARWRALMAITPAEAPWAEMLVRAITELEAGG